MMTSNVTAVPVRALALSWMAFTGGQAGQGGLKMFLECDETFEGWIRFELDDFVTFVDDRREADIVVRVTPDAGHRRTGHYQVDFFGTGRFEMIHASARLHLPDPRVARFSGVIAGDSESARRRSVSGHRPDTSAVM